MRKLNVKDTSGEITDILSHTHSYTNGTDKRQKEKKYKKEDDTK